MSIDAGIPITAGGVSPASSGLHLAYAPANAAVHARCQSESEVSFSENDVDNLPVGLWGQDEMHSDSEDVA